MSPARYAWRGSLFCFCFWFRCSGTLARRACAERSSRSRRAVDCLGVDSLALVHSTGVAELVSVADGACSSLGRSSLWGSRHACSGYCSLCAALCSVWMGDAGRWWRCWQIRVGIGLSASAVCVPMSMLPGSVLFAPRSSVSLSLARVRPRNGWYNVSRGAASPQCACWRLHDAVHSAN